VSVEDVVSRLNKTTKNRIKLANEVRYDRLPLPSPNLTKALGGGLGYGRQSLIWGTKSSGKTTLCLQTVANAQADGKVCAWIDAEQAFDPAWAERLGVDTDNLIISPTKSIAGLAEIGADLMQSGVDVLIVDSISALLPTTFFEKDKDELKDFTGTRQIGSNAKDMANAVQILNYANTSTALVLISQVRNKIFTGGAMMAPMGGFATSFYSSTSIKLIGSSKEADQIKGTVQVGNALLERPIGRTVNWLVDFNKIGPPLRSGKYDLYYDGDFVGIDTAADLARAAIEQGIIKKAGAWYSFADYSWQGEAKVIDAVRYGAVLSTELGELVG
jgi:recombination protein RecA